MALVKLIEMRGNIAHSLISQKRVVRDPKPFAAQRTAMVIFEPDGDAFNMLGVLAPAVELNDIFA